MCMWVGCSAQMGSSMEVSICSVRERSFISTSKLGNILFNILIKTLSRRLACSMEYVRIQPYSKMFSKMDVFRIKFSSLREFAL